MARPLRIALIAHKFMGKAHQHGTAARWGWDRWTHDGREVMADPEIDAVDMASPGNAHAEIASAAAKAGKHVLCEKPLALSGAEARAMLDAADAGSMTDKGSDLVDLARFLAGDFAEVAATSEVFVRERQATGGPKPVTTDVSAAHKNSLGFEVHGSKGAVIFDLERLNELQLYSTSDRSDTQGFRTVMVTQPEHPYIRSWWPPGHVIGWEHTFGRQYYEFLRAIAEKRWVGIPQ